MEQTAEPDTIQISNDTLGLVTGLVDARPRGAVEMKGDRPAGAGLPAARPRQSPHAPRGGQHGGAHPLRRP